MSVNPIRDQVLIKPIVAEKTTAGGLYIPDALAASATKGTVVSTGKGRVSDSGVLIPLTVAEGDVVMYAQDIGDKVKVDNKDHLLLTEDQILGMLE